MYATSRLDGIYVDDTIATKAYADAAAATKLPLAGGTMTGALQVLAGSGDNDAVNVSQIKTGSLGRTAWASGELIKTHWVVGAGGSITMPNPTIPANTTRNLFGNNQFSYTPVKLNSILVLEFTFEIGSSNTLAGFSTVITNNTSPMTFLHNCQPTIGYKGTQVLCKMITAATILSSNPITVTITTTTASAGISQLAINIANWTMTVQEYAA